MGAWLLGQHPVAFAVGAAAWMLAVASALAWLPRRWTVAVAFVVTLAHAVGAASWLTQIGPAGYGLAFVFLFAAERGIGLSWRRGAVENP